MIRDKHIVCIASSWFDHPTSKHHVMRTLARENRVLWINYHASRRPRVTRQDLRLIARRLSRTARGPQQVTPNLNVISPLLVPLPEWRSARDLNAWLLNSRIRTALRDGPPGPRQLWLFTPDIPELIPLLRPERTIYYCVDDFAAFSDFNQSLIESLETRTLAWSDVVVATSRKLYERCRRVHPNTHFVPHGVDYEHFAKAPALPVQAIPEDVRGLSAPVFGYLGLVADYVDLEMIAAAAARRPEWSFVFLGEIRRDVGVVSGLKNVHMLGPRSYESLPAYCRAFDVGLIPFRMTRLVESVNPIKLREYLAAGLPVVSAPMEEVMQYAPSVQTATSLDSFLAGCQAALAERARHRASHRQALVRDESWQARVELLSDIIEGRTRGACEDTPGVASAPAHGAPDGRPGPRTRRVGVP